jgi:hypothetical protein
MESNTLTGKNLTELFANQYFIDVLHDTDRTWDEKTKNKFITDIVTGVEKSIGTITIGIDKQCQYMEIIDGKQRLHALQEFYDDPFKSVIAKKFIKAIIRNIQQSYPKYNKFKLAKITNKIFSKSMLGNYHTFINNFSGDRFMNNCDALFRSVTDITAADLDTIIDFVGDCVSKLMILVNISKVHVQTELVYSH